MEKEEYTTPNSEEIKKEFEININENKLRIEINNDEIVFVLLIGISYYKYIKKF